METTTALVKTLYHRFPRLREAGALLPVFMGTLFLSALLLFSVQPMFARMVLPKLGGAPSVWAVSMCFFQAMLLAGYCYAHLLNRYVSARVAPLVHFSVLLVAVVCLPIGLPHILAEPPPGDPTLWLISTLALGVGVPFFAVSASAPLLQSWFARSGHPHAGDPYFLYGASNLGSLAALLAYPIVIEPFAGIASQSSLWSAGFVCLGLCIAACAWAVVARVADDAAPSAGSVADVTDRPSLADRATWIGLAAVPSGLLVAFTTYLTTDIASAPFLWVIPLALFLATFILVFRDPPAVSHDALTRVQPVLTIAVLVAMSMVGSTGWLIASACGFGAFFVTTMVAHRELYLHRPATQHLTEFYLWMSLGGVLGGTFAALVSPQIFNGLWEYPLFLALGMLCRPGVTAGLAEPGETRRLALIGLGTLVVLAAVAVLLPSNALSNAGTLVQIGLLLAAPAGLLLAIRRSAREALVAALVAAAIAILPTSMNSGDSERSFFGVHHVTMMGKDLRLLFHGTTLHGAERLAPDGRPFAQPVPATYYHPAGPMARGFDVARAATGHGETGFTAGVVGLGAGSLACYSRPAETWRFFEIDPVVVRIARDPARFSFLPRCRPEADIVVGDARLTLAHEPANRFDYLVVDAFSSDSIPVHMLTVEAVQLYLSKLSQDGIVALHISNRHLDLAPVVAAIAAAIPGTRARVVFDTRQPVMIDATSSHVVFLTRSDRAAELVDAMPGMKPLVDTGVVGWTDDYSNILSAIWRKHR